MLLIAIRIRKPAKARLVAPEGVDAARLEVIAAGEALTRDLVNTPASDMGPDDSWKRPVASLRQQHTAPEIYRDHRRGAP